MNIVFLANRLMRMSPPEVVYRFKKELQAFVEKSSLFMYRFDSGVVDEKCHFFYGQIHYKNTGRILQKANNLYNGRMNLFALRNLNIGDRIDYHRDYKSGLYAPRDMFSKNIDYRYYRKIGDIKYIWELNRHLFLVTLAQAFNISGNKKYLEKFKYFLNEWFEQNPFMLGVNWASSLEMAVRLINWTICWHLTNEFLDTNLIEIWLDSIYRHCWFIDRNLSSYSSANNHLIGEAAGLFIASTALPKFKPSQKWQLKAYRTLIQECERQNYHDGVNKEQAVSYQQFVLDFLLLSGIIGKSHNRMFPARYWSTIEKMLEYLAVLEDTGGNLPRFGDEDDGYVVDLGQKEYGTYRSLLNTGAIIFNRKDFLAEDGEIDDKTAVFLNIGDYSMDIVLKELRKEHHTRNNIFYQTPESRKIVTLLEPSSTGKAVLPLEFKEGGYYIMGSSFNTPREQKLVFDCGPLGYLSIAAHGHADALSFFFSAGGCPIFVDPGTYAYHANKEWRDYFRGTSAHNTVQVDGKDQSTIAGNFMWSHKANTRLLYNDCPTGVKGCHDGYGKLKDRVIHSREILYDEGINTWKIIDELECIKAHNIDIHFHLHPACILELDGNVGTITFDRGICCIIFQSDMNISVHEGSTNPLLGWYSVSYDVKLPSKTIRVSGKINGTTTVTTLFRVDFT